MGYIKSKLKVHSDGSKFLYYKVCLVLISSVFLIKIKNITTHKIKKFVFKVDFRLNISEIPRSQPT